VNDVRGVALIAFAAFACSDSPAGLTLKVFPGTGVTQLRIVTSNRTCSNDSSENPDGSPACLDGVGSQTGQSQQPGRVHFTAAGSAVDFVGPDAQAIAPDIVMQMPSDGSDVTVRFVPGAPSNDHTHIVLIGLGTGGTPVSFGELTFGSAGSTDPLSMTPLYEQITLAPLANSGTSVAIWGSDGLPYTCVELSYAAGSADFYVPPGDPDCDSYKLDTDCNFYAYDFDGIVDTSPAGYGTCAVVTPFDTSTVCLLGQTHTTCDDGDGSGSSACAALGSIGSGVTCLPGGMCGCTSLDRSFCFGNGSSYGNLDKIAHVQCVVAYGTLGSGASLGSGACPAIFPATAFGGFPPCAFELEEADDGQIVTDEASDNNGVGFGPSARFIESTGVDDPPTTLEDFNGSATVASPMALCQTQFVIPLSQTMPSTGSVVSSLAYLRLKRTDGDTNNAVVLPMELVYGQISPPNLPVCGDLDGTVGTFTMCSLVEGSDDPGLPPGIDLSGCLGFTGSGSGSGSGSDGSGSGGSGSDGSGSGSGGGSAGSGSA
jgi:hypothetical protein